MIVWLDAEEIFSPITAAVVAVETHVPLERFVSLANASLAATALPLRHFATVTATALARWSTRDHHDHHVRVTVSPR